MFSSNSVKLFYFSVLVLLSFSACRFWAKTDPAPAASPTPFVAEEIPSEIPFATHDPDIYQAEIVRTTFSNGEKSERRSYVARNGSKYLTTFDFGGKHPFSQLQIDGKTYFINHEKKVYAESDTGGSGAVGEGPNDFLLTEWLNLKIDATFENQGEEGGLRKYRVKMGENPGSETVLYFNESFKIPVKQEFYSVAGELRTLMFSIEVTNLRLMADDAIFVLPADFRKISLKEYQDGIRGRNA